MRQLALIALLALTACASPQPQQTTTQTQATAPAVESSPALAEPEARSLSLYADEVGGAWPFTESYVTVMCEGDELSAAVGGDSYVISGLDALPAGMKASLKAGQSEVDALRWLKEESTALCY